MTALVSAMFDEPVVDAVVWASELLVEVSELVGELEVVELEDSSSSSSVSLALAAANVVSASLRSASRVEVPRAASVCPAVTFCPTLTSTASTVPATWKAAEAVLTGSTVAETVRVRSTVDVVATAVW